MSREILFKGFAPNENGKDAIYINDEEIKGDWVYGYYGKTKRICTSQQAPGTFFNIHYIMVAEELQSGETYLKDYEILPETLSQYTELLDENGNKIWENDIVKFSEKYDKNKKNKKGIVQYSINSFLPIIDGIGYTLWHFACEVIGNRWEKE